MSTIKRAMAVFAAAAAIGVGWMAGNTASAEAGAYCQSGQLCLYTDAGYGGRMLTDRYGNNWRDLGLMGFDDRVSSVINNTRISYCAWTGYGFRGDWYLIRPGDHGNVNPFWAWNDTFSSLDARCNRR